MKVVNLRDSPILTAVFLVAKYGIMYLAYSVLASVIFVVGAYLIIILINLTGGDLDTIGGRNLIPIFGWLGVPGSGSFVETDLLVAYAKLSLPIAVIGMLYNFVHPTSKKKVHTTKFKRLKLGFWLITGLMLLSLISAYLPNAAGGANSIWYVILIFWVIALIAFGVYSFLMRMAESISYK